jgi:hypothetical protein
MNALTQGNFKIHDSKRGDHVGYNEESSGSNSSKDLYMAGERILAHEKRDPSQPRFTHGVLYPNQSETVLSVINRTTLYGHNEPQSIIKAVT